MSKVTAPLLSFDAAGQIATTVVYGRWRGIRYARRYVIPANPQTAAQQQNRNAFATLREMFKLAPTLLRAPWDAFATGRKFLGANAFIGENRRAIATAVNMQQFIGSPGARGGLPADVMTAATGAVGGQITVDFTVPTAPPGWTLQASVVALFPDQAPDAPFGGPFAVAEVLVAPWDHIVTGLTVSTPYIVTGWLRWLKPDLKIAYSPSIVTTATSSA